MRTILACTTLAALVLAGPSAVAQPQPAGRPLSAPLTFDKPDDLADWSFSNGPEWPGAHGSLEWRPGMGRDGDGAAALAYNFEQGGNYVAAIVTLPTGREIKAVRLWVHKPAPHLMIFRAVDADGEAFQKNLRYHYPGWQQLEIALGHWEFSWGGDGTFRGPPREFHILIENDGGDRVGTVLIDDVQWVYEPTEVPHAAVARTTYIESDFATGWGYEGAPAGGWAGGAWRYAFTPEQSFTRLHRDRGIVARPQRMLLTIESDGAGHELTAWIGSHFQCFERSLGTLDTPGEVTLEVPLGDMKTWRHFGGEDDGIVRYPLRLLSLTCTQKGEATQGTLKPLRLEFDTEFDRDRETVWIIPSVAPAGADEARFSVELRSLADEPVRGELHWSTHTGDQLVESGREAVELPPRGVPVFKKITGRLGDAPVIEGRFRFQGAGVMSPEKSITLGRPPEAAPPGPVSLRPESGMGVGMYLYRFHDHPDARAWMDRMCRLAAHAGVRWTREEFHWNWIEPRRGEYDFSFFDQLVDSAQAHGISIYALCCYWTTWTQPNTEEGIEDYCRYLETLVRRYGDRIKHWEIWNEPNVFFWSGPKELYPVLLKRAYETIKAVDPQAQVLGCSTAGIDTAFINMVLKADAPFDALTVHPYRGTLDPARFIDELRRVRELCGGRDVWITEMGWPSDLHGLSERDQAQYVARTYISALASGAARSVAWYDFREDGNDPFYNEHHFGLVRNDLTPKIGYHALATVGRLLGEAEFEKQLDLPPDLPGTAARGLLGFQFCRPAASGGAQRIAAIWSPQRTCMATFELKGDSPRLLSMVGEPTGVSHAGRWTTLLERNVPVYVVADGELEIAWKEFPVALRLDNAAVHPGETVTYKMALDATTHFAVHELPPGWKAGRAGEGGPTTITVPPDAAPGRYEVLHKVKPLWSERAFLLPVEITVAAPLIRG